MTICRNLARRVELPAVACVLPQGVEEGAAAALRVLQERADSVQRRDQVRRVGGVAGEAEEGGGPAVGVDDEEEADQGRIIDEITFEFGGS